MLTCVIRGLSILALAAPMSTQAKAATIFNFAFSGNGTSGNILFNGSVADSDPDPLKGLYHNAIVSYVININGTPDNFGVSTFRTLQGTSGDITIGLNTGGIGGCGPVDCIAFTLGAPFLGEGPSDFDLSFYYPVATVPSDALPPSVPARGTGILRGPVEFFLGDTAVTSVAAVPEPAMLPQLWIGLFAMAVLLYTAGRQRPEHVPHDRAVTASGNRHSM